MVRKKDSVYEEEPEVVEDDEMGGDEGEEAQEEGEEKEAKPAEEEAPRREEVEKDAAPIKGAAVKATCTFFTEDTTMNVLPAARGLVTALTDGGFQYLLAGARGSVGMKAGRYLFEVKIIECPQPAEPSGAKAQGPKPKSYVRVGVATEDSSLLLGDGTGNACFDSEGYFIHGDTWTKAGQKVSQGQVIGLVLNLDGTSPNASTISLFKDGVRVSDPQALPEVLKGKVLYPAITFRNMVLQVHFGPYPLRPLPFKCLTWQEAATSDAVVKKARVVKGKHELVVPAGLPDEGTFDWLDKFLEKNKHYVELSDRAVLEWASKSGLTRHGGFARRASNDKPEPNFGLPLMDDWSVQQVVASIAPLLPRSYVIMEVKSNLLQDERKWMLERFPDFKKVAKVVMGEPPAEFKAWVQESTLKEKKAKAEAEAKKAREEAAKKKAAEKEKRKAEKEEKKKKEAKEKKEKESKEAKEGDKEGEEKKEEEKKEDEEEEKKEDEKEEAENKESNEDKKDGEEEAKPEAEAEEEAEEEPDEEMEEALPPVELTEAEKQLRFRVKESPDLTDWELSSSYLKFSIPQKEEGFDEVTYEWQKAPECSKYLATWIAERKLIQRVDDLQPSEWFKTRWDEWSRALSAWRRKQQDFRNPLPKRPPPKSKEYWEEKPKEDGADAEMKDGEGKDKEAEGKKEDGEEGEEKEEKEEGDGEEKQGEENEAAEDEGGEKDGEENEEEEKKGKEKEGSKKEAKAKGKEAAKGDAKEENEEAPMQIDADDLDVWNVEDVADIGNGEPLFAKFVQEDWSLLSLRFELHLLVHAFRNDLGDPERTAFHESHLGFYYNKYYKKHFSVKHYAANTLAEVVELIQDTIEINPKNSTVETHLSEDTPLDNFIRLTEDHRRDRQIRLDAGEDQVVLKFPKPAPPPPTKRKGPPHSGSHYGGQRSAPYGPPPGYGQPPPPGGRPGPPMPPREGSSSYGAAYGGGGSYGASSGPGPAHSYGQRSAPYGPPPGYGQPPPPAYGQPPPPAGRPARYGSASYGSAYGSAGSYGGSSGGGGGGSGGSGYGGSYRR